ncbi:MAG: CoxG family protein [Haloarculaceae archaeon]
MTVRVERTFDLEATPEEVWNLISDPERRARPISVVEDFEVTGDRTATWHISLPIPVVRRTIAIETEDIELDPPNYVKFVGRSKVMRVVGEHRIEAHESGSRVVNRFTVEGRVPGVERFFERNLDRELRNLETAFRREMDERE